MPTTTPPGTGSGRQRYFSSTLGFSVEYPADWHVHFQEEEQSFYGRGHVWFYSDLKPGGQPGIGAYTIGVSFRGSQGRSLEEEITLGLTESGRYTGTHCCLTVGGEPAIEALFWLSRFGHRSVVAIHEGRAYHIQLYPLAWLDGDTPEDTLARAAFELFLRTFAFIPISPTPPPEQLLVPTPGQNETSKQSGSSGFLLPVNERRQAAGADPQALAVGAAGDQVGPLL